MYLYFLTILFVLISSLATSSAENDFKQISKNEPIDHAAQWVARAILSFLAVLSLAFLCYLGTDCSWGLLIVYYSMVSAFWFSVLFRHQLNLKRKLSYDYISNSNVYDSVFITIAGKNGGKLAIIFELVMVAIFSYLSLHV